MSIGLACALCYLAVGFTVSAWFMTHLRWQLARWIAMHFPFDMNEEARDAAGLAFFVGIGLLLILTWPWLMWELLGPGDSGL